MCFQPLRGGAIKCERMINHSVDLWMYPNPFWDDVYFPGFKRRFLHLKFALVLLSPQTVNHYCCGHKLSEMLKLLVNDKTHDINSRTPQIPPIKTTQRKYNEQREITERVSYIAAHNFVKMDTDFYVDEWMYDELQ